MPQRVQDLIIDFCQVFMVNATAFMITFANVEVALKLASLILAIGYTAWKWYYEFSLTKKRKKK